MTVNTKQLGETLSGKQEVGGVNGIILLLVDWDVNKGLLHGIKKASHDCGGLDGYVLIRGLERVV